MRNTQPRRSSGRNIGQRSTQTYAEEFQGDDVEQATLLNLREEDQEIAPLTEDGIEEHVMGVIMTQYALKAGLKRYQEKGEDAVTAERWENCTVCIPSSPYTGGIYWRKSKNKRWAH